MPEPFVVRITPVLSEEQDQKAREAGAEFAHRLQNPMYDARPNKSPVGNSYLNNEYNPKIGPQLDINSPENRNRNLACSIGDGNFTVDLDGSGDSAILDSFNWAFHNQLEACGGDNRYAEGRWYSKSPTHIHGVCSPDDYAVLPIVRGFYSKVRFEFGEASVGIEVRASYKTSNEKHVDFITVPGFIHDKRKDGGEGRDIRVPFDGRGPVFGIPASTDPRRCSPHLTVLPAVMFAVAETLLKPHWTQGNRQQLGYIVLGVFAHSIVNAEDATSAPDKAKTILLSACSDENAVTQGLTRLLERLGDDEIPMRMRLFDSALRKLRDSPNAKIPGWPRFEEAFGYEAKSNLLKAIYGNCTNAVSELDRIIDRIIYNQGGGKDHDYIDKDLHYKNGGIGRDQFKKLDKIRNDLAHITITNPATGKQSPMFPVFNTSRRKHVVEGTACLVKPPMALESDLNEHPHLKPIWGACREPPDRHVIPPAEHFIERIDCRTNKIADGDHVGMTKIVFNTWAGWPGFAKRCADAVKAKRFLDTIDWLMDRVTNSNQNQKDILWRVLAQILREPDNKPHMGYVFVGQQGTAKSALISLLFRAALGGQITAIGDRRSLTSKDDRFALSATRDLKAMIINEVDKFDEATLKELLRDERMSTQKKFLSIEEHDNFCRILMTTNVYRRLTKLWDRALFYFIGENQGSVSKIEWAKHLVEVEIRVAELARMLQDQELINHLFWKLQFEVTATRADLGIEILKHSSGNDDALVWNAAPVVFRAIHRLVGGGGVYPNAEPGRQWPVRFNKSDLGEWVGREYDIRHGHSKDFIPNVDRVLEMGINVGLWELKGGFYEPLVKWGKALEMVAEATEVAFTKGVNLGREPELDEYGDLPPEEVLKSAWRGKF